MIIELETGKRLELPDGSSDDQIDEAVKDFLTTQKAPVQAEQKNQPSLQETIQSFSPTEEKQGKDLSVIDTAKDYAKSLGSGVARSAAFPFDIGSAVGGYIGKKAVGESTLGITPDSAIGRGLENVFGSGGLSEKLPSSLSEAVGGEYQSITALGPYIKKIGEFGTVGKILSPLAPLATPRTAIMSAIGAQGARDIAESTGNEDIAPAAEIAGAVVSPYALPKTAANFANSIRGIAAKSPESIIESIKAGGRNISELYKNVDKLGAVPKVQKLRDIYNSAVNAVGQTGIVDAAKPETTALLNKMAGEIESGKFGLSQLEQYRGLFSDVSGGSRDIAAAQAAQKTIRDAINSLKTSDLQSGSREAVNALNFARASAAKNFKYNDIANMIVNSGGEPSKFKSALTSYIKKYNGNLEKAGFTAQEAKVLKDAAKTGFTEGTFNLLGRMGFDLSNINKNWVPAALLGGGTYSGVGPKAIGAVIGGTGARQAGKWIGRGKAQNALNTIANRPIVIPELAQEIAPAAPSAPAAPQIAGLLGYRPMADFVVSPSGKIATAPTTYPFSFGSNEGMPFTSGELNFLRSIGGMK